MHLSASDPFFAPQAPFTTERIAAPQQSQPQQPQQQQPLFLPTLQTPLLLGPGNALPPDAHHRRFPSAPSGAALLDGSSPGHTSPRLAGSDAFLEKFGSAAALVRSPPAPPAPPAPPVTAAGAYSPLLQPHQLAACGSPQRHSTIGLMQHTGTPTHPRRPVSGSASPALGTPITLGCGPVPPVTPAPATATAAPSLCTLSPAASGLLTADALCPALAGLSLLGPARSWPQPQPQEVPHHTQVPPLPLRPREAGTDARTCYSLAQVSPRGTGAAHAGWGTSSGGSVHTVESHSSHMRQSASMGTISAYAGPPSPGASVSPQFDIHASTFTPRPGALTPRQGASPRQGTSPRVSPYTPRRRHHHNQQQQQQEGYGDGAAAGATTANFEGLTFQELCENFEALAVDENGSKYIVARLVRTQDGGEREALFAEVRRTLPKLVHDMHGNLVVQAFLEHGSAAQRAYVYEHALRGNVGVLSLHPSGCRVVQRALERVEPATRSAMARELEHTVLKCVTDQNGNHVVQKCIETADPPEAVQFMLDAFRGQVVPLARHPYGCRVLQRIIEHCTAAQAAPLVDELLAAVDTMLTDQFGNYVVQHVMTGGTPRQRRAVVRATRGRVLELSRHKFASNVMEKCVEFGDPADCDSTIVAELLHAGGAPLLALATDPYGNYVVQKLLDVAAPATRERLLAVLWPAADRLEQHTYSRHILQCMAKHDPLRQVSSSAPCGCGGGTGCGGSSIVASSTCNNNSGSGGVSSMHSFSTCSSSPSASSLGSSPASSDGPQRRAQQQQQQQNARHRQSRSGSTSPYLAASIDIGGTPGAHVRGRTHRSSHHSGRSSSSSSLH